MPNSHITNFVNAVVNKVSTLINSHNSSNDAHSSLFDAKAPKSHAVNASTYGLGTTGVYGHCKTVNNVTTSAHSNGLALSAYQGKILKGLIDNKANSSEVYTKNEVYNLLINENKELISFIYNKHDLLSLNQLGFDTNLDMEGVNSLSTGITSQLIKAFSLEYKIYDALSTPINYALLIIFDNDYTFSFDSNTNQVEVSIDGATIGTYTLNSNISLQRAKVDIIFYAEAITLKIGNVATREYEEIFNINLQQYGIAIYGSKVRDDIFFSSANFILNSAYINYILLEE